MDHSNPYTLMFGRIPRQYISRPAAEDEILGDFQAEQPSQTVYIVTGIRGSGKTVLMTDIEDQLRKDSRWMVINLNPAVPDLVDTLAKKISRQKAVHPSVENAEASVSAFGIGISFKGQGKPYEAESVIEEALIVLQEYGKRLLVTIDEVSKTEQMRIFAGTFQSLMRKGLPIFLLMTGLYENIELLQNVKDLTFLYRAPKIMLEPLNETKLAENYMEVLALDEEQAIKCAASTKGYPFAFQALGYYLWKYENNEAKAMEDALEYVSRYSYRKIWEELSDKDRAIAAAIAESDAGETGEILKILNISNSAYSPYRRRLTEKGIITSKRRGYVQFVLPWFKEFVNTYRM